MTRDIYTEYKEDNELEMFNIIHLYPGENTADDATDGYVNQKFFEVVGFNSETGNKRFRKLPSKKYDGIFLSGIYNGNTILDVGVWGDGSFIITFKEPISFTSFTGKSLHVKKQERPSIEF